MRCNIRTNAKPKEFPGPRNRNGHIGPGYLHPKTECRENPGLDKHVRNWEVYLMGYQTAPSSRVRYAYPMLRYPRQRTDRPRIRKKPEYIDTVSEKISALRVSRISGDRDDLPLWAMPLNHRLFHWLH